MIPVLVTLIQNAALLLVIIVVFGLVSSRMPVRRHWRHQLLALLVLQCLLSPPLSADTLILVADEWCPHNCGVEDQNRGYLVELAESAFQVAGHEVVYRTLPWARSIHGVRRGHYTGIIATGHDETPDFLFPAEPQGVAKHTFFVLQGNDWRYSDLDSLNEVTLGVINNYSYGTLYEDYIRHHEGDRSRIQRTYGETPLRQNIEKLLRGRIDALVEEAGVLRDTAQKLGYGDQIVAAGVASVEELYIAFSPVSPKAAGYAELLSEAMVEMRQSGELDHILGRYGLSDWKEAE